jgi:hypothetical protein
MMASVINGALGIWLMILMPSLSYAEEPSGFYFNQLGEPGTALWDLSGWYDEYFADFPTTFSISQDDRGNINGWGYVRDSSDEPLDNSDFTISGSIKRKGGVTSAILTAKWVGAVHGKIKFNLSIENYRLVGSAKGNLCFQDEDCFRIDPQPVSFSIPGGQDGTWVLVTSVIDSLDGMADATLRNGRMVPFIARWGYSASKDLTKLTLEGESKKTKLTIKGHTSESPHEFRIHKIEGTVLGQKIELETLGHN